MSSIRIAGFYNIFISATVAVLSYIALMMIASKFGGNAGSDAYFYLLSLTTLSSGLISVLFGVVMVPTFVEIMTNECRTKADEFASSIFSIVLILVLPIIATVSAFHNEFFLFATKYSKDDIYKIDFILVYFSPILLSSVLAEFFRFLALALTRYTLAAIGAIFQPIFTIVLIYSYTDIIKEEVLPIALLSSKLVILVLCFFVLLKYDKLVIHLFSIRKNDIFRFSKTSTPYFFANIITNFAGFTFDYLATGLSTGVLSSIAYAQRIVMLPIAVFINPIMEIARTRFAIAKSRGDINSLANQHNILLQLILYFTIPVSIFLFVYSELVISVMFNRGAFSQENLRIAASCLSVFAVAIPFSAIFYLNGRVVESFQRLTWPSFFGSITHLILIATTYLFVNQYGYIGIPTAKTFVEIFIFFPFGIIAMKLFLGFFPKMHVFKVTAFSIISSSFALLLCNLSVMPYRDSYPNIIWFALMLLTFFVIIYSILITFFDRRIPRYIIYLVRRL